MSQLSAVAEVRYSRVQQARDVFFGRGEVPDRLVERALIRSWERCRRAGLDFLAVRDSGAVASVAALRDACERHRHLLAHAQSIMDHVYEQIRHSGSVVILSNEEGLVLHSIGDADFVERAELVALRPGASWDERERGTNAIGTALAEGGPVEVVGAEHYLERNGFLTCSATPLFDPQGQLIGALDISGDYRGYQRHTLGLVRMSAQLVEKRLFESAYTQELLLAFHPRPEYVGSLGEGLAALAPDGRILAVNPAGLEILGLRRDEATRLNCSLLFNASPGALVDRARRDSQALQAVTTARGQQLHLRMRGNLPPLAVPARLPTDTARIPSTRRPGACGEMLTLDTLCTGDARLQGAIDRARRVLGRDIPILIQGESGAGKEMFAKAFHNGGPRRSAPFVALNCAAIPETLIESELFGYQGGAFTGARKEGAVGKIQQAHGGTLFLDEIGDMPLNLQARLLRVLQERSVTPLGGGRTIAVDISLVCATHRHLKEEVAERRFREDLYYRLNGLSVCLPPLRERTDLRQLATSLLRVEAGAREVAFSEEAMLAFERYAWPGNIRQLNNVIRVAIALLEDDERAIAETHLPEELFEELPLAALEAPQPAAAAAHPRAAADAASLEEVERQAVQRALEAAGGNISAAARMLGVSRNTLYRKLGRL